MELLSLPLEVVRTIIYQLVAVCGLYDAVLLRTVSKMFNEEILFAICNTDLIDFRAYAWSFEMDEFMARRILLAKSMRQGASSNFLIRAVRRIATDYVSLEKEMGRPGDVDRISDVCAAVMDIKTHQFVALQIKKGDNPHDYIEEKETGQLALAAYLGDEKAVLHLLDRGVDLNRETALLERPLKAAARNGQAQICSLLLERERSGNDDEEVQVEEWSALVAAAAGGHEHVLQLFLKPRYGFQRLGWDYENAMLEAARKGRTGIVRLLMGHATFRNPYEIYAELLKVAGQFNHLELLEHLLTSNREHAQRALAENSSIMVLTASRGHFSALQMLLSASPKGTTFPFYHDTFVSAIRKGGVQVVKYLLGMGVDVNRTSRYGTPIEVAIRCGQLELLRLFFEHGADISKINLISAVKRGDERIIRFLVSAGVDANRTDESGVSPMLVAMLKSGNERTIELLRNLGAQDVDPLASPYAEEFRSGKYPSPNTPRGYVPL